MTHVRELVLCDADEVLLADAPGQIRERTAFGLGFLGAFEPGIEHVFLRDADLVRAAEGRVVVFWGWVGPVPRRG